MFTPSIKRTLLTTAARPYRIPSNASANLYRPVITHRFFTMTDTKKSVHIVNS